MKMSEELLITASLSILKEAPGTERFACVEVLSKRAVLHPLLAMEIVIFYKAGREQPQSEDSHQLWALLTSEISLSSAILIRRTESLAMPARPLRSQLWDVSGSPAPRSGSAEPAQRPAQHREQQ